MSRYYRSTSSGFGYPVWSPAVRALIISCVAVFVLQFIEELSGGGMMVRTFGLTPYLVTHHFFLWQLASYIFLHGNPLHILFNMLGLWMFGSDLERHWGTRQFVTYFFICGVGAGALTTVVSPSSHIATIGASGAIYGILLAYAMNFPNRIIYMIIFPIPAKWFAVIMGALAFFSSFNASSGGVANIAHLGGMLVGFLYLRGGRIVPQIRRRYVEWQHQRLRRKFDVYYNEKQRKDRDKRPN